jgi:hypothetical protein
MPNVLNQMHHYSSQETNGRFRTTAFVGVVCTSNLSSSPPRTRLTIPCSSTKDFGSRIKHTLQEHLKRGEKERVRIRAERTSLCFDFWQHASSATNHSEMTQIMHHCPGGTVLEWCSLFSWPNLDKAEKTSLVRQHW